MPVFETGMLRGAALAEQGAVDKAIARIREGVTKWTAGRTFLLPYSLAFLAQGLVRHRDQAAALAACARVWRWQMSRASILGCGTTPPYRDRAARRKQARRGRSLPSARNPHCASPTSEIAGIARHRQPRAALA